MEKMTKALKKKSIKTAFAAYMLVCILCALLLSLLLSEIFQFGQTQLCKKYKTEYEAFAHHIEMEDSGSDGDHGVLSYYTEDIRTLFTPFELSVYNLFDFFSMACYPLCFIVCIIITSILFYQKQLQKPLELLDHAADNIADNNLDFQIVYHKPDELGKLCVSFEKMRLALRDTYAQMWRQMEERKRLNAAFAHDLRTPLTVLKGQSEMLIKYSPKMSEQKIIEVSQMMQRHIIRLEQYTSTMNTLQRLEDIDIQKTETAIADAAEQMKNTAETVCKTKKLIIEKKPQDTGKLNLDMSVIMHVYENLLANAIRYACNVVSISISVKDGCFHINISDDGKGFTAKELSEAMKPFYKSSDERNQEHFGIGLYICKILCEKHGGYLQLENHNGASVTATFKA